MWSEKEKKILSEILDELIPANPDKKIPSAGQLGVVSFIFEVASKTPKLQDDIKLVLEFVISKADKVSPYLVREMERLHPRAFGSLLTETYKGYYSRSDIRKKLDLSEKPVHPFGYEVKSESNEYLKELTENVRARGTVYRDPTGGFR
ncbi:MAG: hypothetical protein CML70_05650 [Rhodobacterales bacterium]|jgi:hypothetical protein|nr:MAG: hypothetical protein CML70_05650 [Rhodobacterales bacterium]|tara:strand:- start:1009 stop:1452 length:444 start_codon:yes stop_codon:yes gene_type:complete